MLVFLNKYKRQKFPTKESGIFVFFVFMRNEDIKMAIDLQRLVQKVSHMDVSLVGGEKGIHNSVTWVHMVETIEATSFLEGGEIAFTTGLGLQTTTLLELVSFLYKNHASGIMVNLGPFIDNIPQEVIDFCNENDFPIYCIPWRIHLAEIMRIFCFTINKEDQKNLENTSAFKNAIFFPKQEELYIIPLSQHGFHVHWNYSVMIIQLNCPAEDQNNRLNKILHSIENYGYHKIKDFSAFERDHEIILIFGNCSEESLRSSALEIIDHTKSILLTNESLTIGCGKLTQSIRCLYKSYKQAKSIVNLHKTKQLDSNLIFYSDLGIYKLLMAIEDNDIIHDYYAKTIEPLLIYDKENKTDFSQTLKCYLSHNGSVKETADELFVHRNTINYKLNKIEELLDLDLSSLDARLQLTVGFMLKDML